MRTEPVKGEMKCLFNSPPGKHKTVQVSHLWAEWRARSKYLSVATPRSPLIYSLQDKHMLYCAHPHTQILTYTSLSSSRRLLIYLLHFVP